MLKSTFSGLFLGLITLSGCTSTTPTTPPTTPACTTNADCSSTPTTPICTSNACTAETATACVPGGGTFCPTLGQQCNTAGNACVVWPRLAFLTKNNYTLGVAYSNTSNSINSKSDADKACQAEYVANAGSTYTAFPSKMFKAVMATTGSSMYTNTLAFAQNPRVINDLVAFRTNNNVALTTPTAGPLPTTAVSTCTNTVPGFDCFGNGTVSKFQIAEIAGIAQQYLLTGAVPAASFTAGDVSGFFTAGTTASTCTNWSSSTLPVGAVPGVTADSQSTWSGTYATCANTNILLLCLESD